MEHVREDVLQSVNRHILLGAKREATKLLMKTAKTYTQTHSHVLSNNDSTHSFKVAAFKVCMYVFVWGW